MNKQVTERDILLEQVKGLEAISKQLTAIDDKLWWVSMTAKLGFLLLFFWFIVNLR